MQSSAHIDAPRADYMPTTASSQPPLTPAYSRSPSSVFAAAASLWSPTQSLLATHLLPLQHYMPMYVDDVPSLEIDIDQSALETFVCPAFDEATAVELDDNDVNGIDSSSVSDGSDRLLLPLTLPTGEQSRLRFPLAETVDSMHDVIIAAATTATSTHEPLQVPISEPATVLSTSSTSPYADTFESLSSPVTPARSLPSQHGCSFQSLLESDVALLLSPSTSSFQVGRRSNIVSKRPNSDDNVDAQTRCSYRKGKCHEPRTRKRNGALHTYCALHRARSIANQKNFDARRRNRRSDGSNTDDSNSGDSTTDAMSTEWIAL